MTDNTFFRNVVWVSLVLILIANILILHILWYSTDEPTPVSSFKVGVDPNHLPVFTEERGVDHSDCMLDENVVYRIDFREGDIMGPAYLTDNCYAYGWSYIVYDHSSSQQCGAGLIRQVGILTVAALVPLVFDESQVDMSICWQFAVHDPDNDPRYRIYYGYSDISDIS